MAFMGASLIKEELPYPDFCQIRNLIEYIHRDRYASGGDMTTLVRIDTFYKCQRQTEISRNLIGDMNVRSLRHEMASGHQQGRRRIKMVKISFPFYCTVQRDVS